MIQNCVNLHEKELSYTFIIQDDINGQCDKTNSKFKLLYIFYLGGIAKDVNFQSKL